MKGSMSRQEIFERFLSRLPLHRRLIVHAWSLWYDLVDWVLDKVYGAPHEAHRRKN